MYGQGISKIGEILDLGVIAGLVEKSGAWFSYDSIRIGQGRETAKTFLAENPELMTRLETAILGRPSEVAAVIVLNCTRLNSCHYCSSLMPSFPFLIISFFFFFF